MLVESEGVCEMSRCLSPINIKVGILKKPASKSGYAKVPCGYCINCKINKKRILQNRLVLESAVWEKSCHVALTFNDEHLPNPPYINVKTTQLFIKKIRRRISPIKYFICGEYGFQGERVWNPHYHAILYGVDPVRDFEKIALSWTDKNGELMCDIEQLKPVELTPELASYCCGYVAKKARTENNRWINRDQAFIYRNFPKENQEFANWSNGLGLEAIKKIKKEVVKTGKTFNTIRSGDRKFPLGRYLKQFTEGSDYGNVKTGNFIRGYKPYNQELVEFFVNQEKMYDKRMKGNKKLKYSTERRSL